MSEKAQGQGSEEPAPIKESDANRVTPEESERASRGPRESTEEDTAQDDDQ
jgi:hypothetical protein